MGQLISTLVFFFMAIWLAYEASDFYSRGNLIKAIPIFIGSLLALLATFVFKSKALLTSLRNIDENKLCQLRILFCYARSARPWGCRRFGFKSHVLPNYAVKSNWHGMCLL